MKQMIENWAGRALNTAPDSQNEIHGEVVSRQFGFKGGLVPGTTISAYVLQPAVVAWGMDWLQRGVAAVRIVSPLYDEDAFAVRVISQSEADFEAELTNAAGNVSAMAEASLPMEASEPPRRRHDPVAAGDFVAPQASEETFARLQREGCLAFRYLWSAQQPMSTYLRDPSRMPDLLHPEGQAHANMSFLLGCANWVLAGNAHMNPWVHLETRSRNYRAVPIGTCVIAEMQILECFTRKGHRFVDVDVNLFDEATDACLMSIFQRAIYRLRGM